MDKIIDAHIHFCEEDYFDEIALNAKHQNSEAHLKDVYIQKNIQHAIVMGNRSLKLEEHIYPDFMSYCIGLDSSIIQSQDISKEVVLVEKHLQRKTCVGIKLYPGYNPYYVYDEMYEPFYELIQKYKKPVAIHTGMSAGSNALLKYCHPLTVDIVATKYPDIPFVLCHLGNPWIQDAVAVMEKNENVFADLSGMIEGYTDMCAYFKSKEGYINYIKTWLQYLERYDKLMYGTDWPLANIDNYIDFVKEIIPEQYYEAVFYQNAKRIYNLDI